MATKPGPVQAEVPDYDAAGTVPEAGEGGEGWHPDLPRVAFEALLGKDIYIEEVEYRDSEYETDPDRPAKQYALIKFRPIGKSVPGDVEGDSVVVEADAEATTATGGVRVVDQLRRAVDAMPLKVEVGQEKTKRGYKMWVLK